MRIVIDINHPAHVHYFKNFIWKMEKIGHEILIIATKKDNALELLDNYGFNYIDIGSYGDSIIRKMLNIPIIDLKMYKKIKSFDPDLFLGFGSIRASHVSFLLRKKCIIFEDTEHSMEQIRLYLPFIDTVYTPSCFGKELGKKQIRFDGYMEFSYLHPDNFTPDSKILEDIGLNKNDKFFLLRFVSWKASHDMRQRGIKNKLELVKILEKFGHVLITSEGRLEKDLEKYRLNIPPEKIHDVLNYATLYIGEGATMATESAILGTPSIFVSSLIGTMGNLLELEQKYNLLFSYDNTEYALKKAIELIQISDLKEEWGRRRKILVNDKIDVAKFMTDLVI